MYKILKDLELDNFHCIYFVFFCRYIVGNVVVWSKRRHYDRHGLGSKLTRAILLCRWEKHFTILSPSWWSWQAVLNFSHASIKLKNQK